LIILLVLYLLGYPRKPVVLMHASHRGDDVRTNPRIVLSTLADRFSQDIFLRMHLMKMQAEEVTKAV
jgi:chromate reductase